VLFRLAVVGVLCSPLELDLSTVPASSTLAANTSSLLSVTTSSSEDSSVTAPDHVSVVKRSASAENKDEPSSGEVSPACKVLKLVEDVPTAVTGRVKPGMSHYVFLFYSAFFLF